MGWVDRVGGKVNILNINIMNEHIIQLIFAIVIIFLFSLNLRGLNLEKTYKIMKEKEFIWLWFDLFKKERSKENFIALYKLMSLFVISIMGLSIIFLIYNWKK
jgi:hypothetical protein